MVERNRTSCKGGKKQAQGMADHSLKRDRGEGERSRFIRDRVGRSLSVRVLWD